MATYFIDIDDTICTLTEHMNYASAQPIPRAIDKVNQLFLDGNEIVFWTARGTQTGIDWRQLTGTQTGIDWRQLTESQLSSWGVQYHELRFGKPVYDWFIDDKNINTIDWLNGTS